MTIILSIIVLVALISLYDYFSAKNWQQVTSAVRNDVVFEKRNKAYGAYVIRRDYNKRMILIMAGVVGSVGATYGAFMIANTMPEMKEVKKHYVELDTVLLDLERKEMKLPEIKIEKQQVESVQKMVDFRAPVVEDDPVDPTLKLVEGETPIGGSNQEGKEGFTPIEIELPIIDITIPPVVENEDPVDVDELPEFPGGRKAMYEFLGQNLVYPELPREMGVEGKCWVRFIVDKNGEISDVRVTREVDGYPEFGKESVRVIKKMPKWRPGKLNGKAVKSYFDMPLNYVLDEK